MKTQVTKLEMELLNLIKLYTEEQFSSDSPMWCYTNDIDTDMIIMRGVISSLIKKEIIKIESYQSKNDGLSVASKYYKVGEDYIANFINLEQK
tara:strand:+ start:198 stop:476 length:279 start_codon:yes stop_codon:yes gene_type:complete